MQKFINLSELNGNNGFSVYGANADDLLGISISKAGDINNDGYADIIMGASSASPGNKTQAGAAYIIFGKASGFPASFDLTTLDGSNGFTVYGANVDDLLGVSVSTAGDINNDGYADIIMGATWADSGNKTDAGAAYIMFGKPSGFPASFDLTTLDGSNGFTVYGANVDDLLGVSVSTAGDINNDGYADIIMGASGASPGNKTYAGAAYIMFGKASGFPASFDLKTLDGNNGFAVYGANAGDRLGRSVGTAGDINGDGYADIIMGAGDADFGNKTFAGAAYVIFGKPSAFPASFDLTTLDGNNGFAVYGANAGDRLGRSVGTAGDINGDGYADIIMGAPLADSGSKTDAGAAYIMFGKASGFPASFDLTTLNGNNGFSVGGANAADTLGFSANTAGDINNDGYADIIMGAYGVDSGNKTYAGAAYIMFGKASGFPVSFDLTTLDGNNGFSIALSFNGANAFDYLGGSVSTAGDINNDGYADIIMGAPYADSGSKTDAGAAYIMFGTSSTSTPTATSSLTSTPTATSSLTSTPTATSSPSTTSTPTASSASSISAGSSYLLMAGALTYLAGERIYDWMKSDSKAKPIKTIAKTPTRQGSSFMDTRSKTLAALASSKTDYPSFSKAAQPESANDNRQSSMRVGMSMR